MAAIFLFSWITEKLSTFLDINKKQKNPPYRFTPAYQISRENIEKQKSYEGLKFGRSSN